MADHRGQMDQSRSAFAEPVLWNGSQDDQASRGAADTARDRLQWTPIQERVHD
jgi:hypothetical protein